MSRLPSRRTVAIGALALLLAGAPFLPRALDNGSDGAIEPAAVPTDRLLGATAGRGQVTEAMRREIDAVLSEGRTTARTAPGSSIRCADFDGQQYCLGVGWSSQSETDLQREAAISARRTDASTETTGDLDAAALARRTAALSPAQREQADRAELTRAAASVAKVWLLRHQVQGVALPEDFLARHPEVRLAAARTTTTEPTMAPPPEPTGTRAKTEADYPERHTVLSTRRVAEQTKSYWCGPTSMQMIEWNWNGTRQSQDLWASKLGTTRDGSAITDMVKVTNDYTGWDRTDRAGKYVTLDIADWSYNDWWLLQLRHYHDYRAPIILHPVLRKEFYPYLDDDASGHFQVGRGYDKKGEDPDTISYFEPWNQQRFDPSEPYIARVQWRSAYRSYRANRAHFQHNLGV